METFFHQHEGSNWFCPNTGIYHSKYKSMQLPTTPFLDVVSFIFSHNHNNNNNSSCASSDALIDSSTGFSLSYSQLLQMVKSMASGLHKTGITKGQSVLILLPNTIFFPVVFLGVMSLGAISIVMSALSTPIEIKKQVAARNVALIFTFQENLSKLTSLDHDVPVVGVPNNLDFDPTLPEFSSLVKFLSSNDHFEFAVRPEINQQDTAAILFSSGTTGVSKAVALSHGNLIAAVELFVRFVAFQFGGAVGSRNVYLAAIPMYHIFGLTIFSMGLFSLGSKIVVMRRFDVVEMVRAIDKFGITHFPLVPPILMALIRAKAVGGCELGSLERVFCGGAPLHETIIKSFLQHLPHVDFVQGYGMTESTAVGTSGFNSEKFTKYTSVGLLAPNMQAKVVNLETGSPLPPGMIGELWLQGPGIMKGYVNDAIATESTIDRDGWLHTGDIGHFDSDGYLYILDRLKEMIKYKGFQIAPADLEAILVSHPDILDVAVTASRDNEAGELPVAFVVKKPGTALSQEDVINFVALQVAPYKKVRKVIFTHSIPKSPSGKILRRQLKSLLSKM